MMKKHFCFILFITLLFLLSCNKDSFRNEMSVSEFYSYTGLADTPCTGKLKHDGRRAAVSGYIYKLNTFLGESRFFIYENSSVSSATMEVHIKKDLDHISEKITKELSGSEYKKISVRGKISGDPLPVNGDCVMGAFLDVDDANDIRF
jgi:hypothetical protein